MHESCLLSGSETGLADGILEVASPPPVEVEQSVREYLFMSSNLISSNDVGGYARGSVST
jgi:hypothetical protein